MPEAHSSKTDSSAELSPLRPGIDDWSTIKNQNVVVHTDGKISDRGWVDDVMPDGSILWLINDGASGRRMVENQSGTFIHLIQG
ncbi:hypothetical protein MOD31_21225 [Paenarthrobacter sp. TYUT067]|uniref:hypothetical protein n=1 Tax=Paenarthrobacter sp. TYUT067 TaxID=2926245 RepID=UPI002030CB8E|nr:hypothetical protein [Paenarthrobacter sp. TYUT067]MCM0618553.1 hypothetical protein [Paenarthrobacter sp. TYUT067]